MSRFKDLGCKAVTITGGGERLLYPNLNVLIGYLNRVLDIRVGLVTNGTQFQRLSNFNDITWCRISSSDDREPCWDGITEAVQDGPKIDWAFSHVLTRNPDWQRLGRLVNFANDYKFTHVRIVADLLDIDKAAGAVRVAKDFLGGQGIDDSLVIYQDRGVYVLGRKNCLISLLKPVVGADGGIYPCCGVQYAQDEPGRDLVKEMCMGTLENIEEIWKEQNQFDGSVCSRCYYDDYNSALALLSTPLNHKEFV